MGRTVMRIEVAQQQQENQKEEAKQQQTSQSHDKWTTLVGATKGGVLLFW